MNTYKMDLFLLRHVKHARIRLTSRKSIILEQEFCRGGVCFECHPEEDLNEQEKEEAFKVLSLLKG